MQPDNSSDNHSPTDDLVRAIKQRFAAALLKLEHFVHVLSTAVDEFLGELHHLISSVPFPLSFDIFHQKNLPVDGVIIKEIAEAVCGGNPVQRSIQQGGPLSSAYQRKRYYRENFNVVNPMEYVLDAKKKHTFQYVPIIKSLQQLLNRRDIIDKVEWHKRLEGVSTGLYKSSRDGSRFKDNGFLSSEEPRIILNLYMDDFATPSSLLRRNINSVPCIGC